jgi:hypothetical protein
MNERPAAMRLGVLILVLHVLVIGCTRSPSCHSNKSSRATPEKGYRIELRFGSDGVLEALDFDARVWAPEPPGWKPTILPIPPDTLHGTITLRRSATRAITDRAEFVSDSDERVLFRVVQVACR